MTFRPILPAPAPAASASAVRLSSSRGGRLPGCTALLLAVVSMLAARAVRNKKKKSAEEKAEVPRGPYIKPFGPTFDASELPYFKYKRALEEAKELQSNISKAKQSAAARRGLIQHKNI